jgi:subtilisin-like proprotein convertase family protein
VADRSTAESSLVMAADVEIEEVNVYVDVTHPYVGDLHVTVTSPHGTPVVLHNRSGGSSDNIVGWFDTNKPTFDPLERFLGEPSSGTWTLQVGDGVPGSTGTLNAWSVEVCGRPFEARPPEARLVGGSRRDGIGVIEWWPYPGLSGYRVYRSASPSQAAAFADVTSADPDPTDTAFPDPTDAPVLYYIVTGVSPRDEAPWGHFGQ